TEIYQEGLQLPGVKLFESGKINQAVVDIIEMNVRLPNQSLGDMWAQIAALRTGKKRFEELCQKYKKQYVIQSINLLLEQGKELSKQALKKLPKGTFEAADFIEDDPKVGGPYPIN